MIGFQHKLMLYYIQSTVLNHSIVEEESDSSRAGRMMAHNYIVKIEKQLAGSIKALWHKSPALWSMGFVPSGRHTAALGYKSHTTI